jgi:hypothetical protein
LPKPKYILSPYLKNGLYWKVIETTSFPIYTKADCRKVCELFQIKGLPVISESTLYRLFLVEESDNMPYLHTLDILAKFCKYKNWFSLEKHLHELANFEWSIGKVHSNNKSPLSLLTVCIHHNELKSVYNFAEQFDETLEIEKKFILGAEFYKALKTNPNKNDLFFKNFSKLPIIRESFFEYMADPTFIIPNYEIGLKYYLFGIKPEHSAKSLQDFVFGNCLLFRYSFLHKNKLETKKLGVNLYETYNFSVKDLAQIHVFPRIRYLAYKLLYLNTINSVLEIEKHETWLLNYVSKNLHKLSLEEKRIVFHTIADTFVNNTLTKIDKHRQLKNMFIDVTNTLPAFVKEISLKDALPYLNRNAANVWKL